MPFTDDHGGARVALVHRGDGFTLSATSGVIAAGLAVDSLLFAVKANTLANLKSARLFLARYVLEYTTIAAFTTPITAGRRLVLARATGGPPTGGNALTPPAMDSGNAPVAALLPVDARIAAAAALAAGGTVREANPLDTISLAHVGTAGAYRDRAYQYHGSSPPITLNPSELLVVSNPVAMDAAGTFQISITLDFQVATAPA